MYERHEEFIAAIVGRNRVPDDRRGPNDQLLMVVIYSADRGQILTGYQIRDTNELNIPDDARWLAA